MFGTFRILFVPPLSLAFCFLGVSHNQLEYFLLYRMSEK